MIVLNIIIIAAIVLLFIRQQKIIKTTLKVQENKDSITIFYKEQEIYNAKPKMK